VSRSGGPEPASRRTTGLTIVGVSLLFLLTSVLLFLARIPIILPLVILFWALTGIAMGCAYLLGLGRQNK
jgi:hypothetical protein